MQRFDSITTGRLTLRRWKDEDRAPFAELNGDPETLVFFPATLSRQESDAFVDRIEARFERDGYGLWALEVSQTGEFHRLHRPRAAAQSRAQRRRHGDRLATGQARLAPGLRHRGGAGGAWRRLRRDWLFCA